MFRKELFLLVLINKHSLNTDLRSKELFLPVSVHEQVFVSQIYTLVQSCYLIDSSYISPKRTAASTLNLY